MSRFQIEDAVRRGNKARVALAAPAGGGKTFTALTIATELAEGGEILVLDTERGSASLYADLFKFKTIKWEPPYDPRELASEITSAAARFAVVVVDSMSHFWTGEGGTLAIVDAAAARASGNKFVGWNAGTPAQDSMVAAMLTSPCHVIGTMRSKMEYVQEKDGNNKTVIRRVGMAPVQRDGIEYEFTVTADLDIEHNLFVAKTRCSALAGASFAPGDSARMGSVLKAWLDGAEAEALPTTPEAAKRAALGWSEADEKAWRDSYTARAKKLDPSRKADFKADAEGLGLVWREAIPKATADGIDKLFTEYENLDPAGATSPASAPQRGETAPQDPEPPQVNENQGALV